MPTILVADDNSNIQKMVTLAFRGEGIDVVAVGNGEAAVKKAIEIVPDLVLADIFMPVRSGYEVCDFIKQDPRFSHIPVILLAGAFDPFDEKEAQRVGADGVLKKPFVPPDPLLALVKELLAKNAERLVSVAAPVQASSVSAQSSSAAPETPAVPAFAPPTSVAPPFTAPSFVIPSPNEESNEDDVEATAVVPIRDFSIPATPAESEHSGGADAFGSMLETSPLETELSSMHKLSEPESAEETEEDREIQPASAHSAFEGFSPWRASASSAPITEDEEAVEPANQFMPSANDLMGRVWEVDPSLENQSPDETVIEPRDEISPLTHSSQHVTMVRDESEKHAETPEVTGSVDAIEPEKPSNSSVSDWRSALAQAQQAATPDVDSPAPSMSPWRMFTPPAEGNSGEHPEETSAAHARETDTNSDAASGGAYSAEYLSPVVEAGEPIGAEKESVSAPATESAEPEVDQRTEVAESSTQHSTDENAETNDWIAEQPQHLSTDDSTAIARSVIEQLAPGAVESVATSFPIPTEAPTDPRVVEEIVARVVERMQPQILEIITREVLRPVVEALVRRQLEQKLPG